MIATPEDPSRPQLGDISLRILDSVFKDLTLSGKLRFFTTQDIKQRNIILVIEKTQFLGNRGDKGYLFDFKHNFRQTIFKDCLIQGNDGYFLEADPSD